MTTTLIEHYLKKHGFGVFSPKAVLFDMDGVLYDSMPHHAIAWQQAMKTFGIDMTAHDAYATEGARGIDTIRLMARQQMGKDIDENEAQRMYDEKSRLFHLMDEAPLMPGIMELMHTLSSNGLLIGVVTGSGQRPLLNRLLKDFSPMLTPDHIVTAYDVSRGKPHPEPYLKGLQKMGDLQPWQAMVVENAPLGVRAAVAARIFTVAVNTGPLPDDCLLDENPDLLCHHMSELTKRWNETL